MHKICIIGTGYIGLVSGACFAELGNKVICVDQDQEKIFLLEQGICPIYEPGLSELIIKNKLANKLFFTTDIDTAIKESDIIFIAVGTPPLENGEADLSAIEDVSKIIAKKMNGYKLIVEKSTVPIKTNLWVKHTIKIHQNEHLDFDLASNPEFLREGSAVQDFMKPDRIVIGVESEKAEKILKELYAPLNSLIIVTDINSAELIKHASNCFLAMKISYINVISDLCEKIGADIEKVAFGMGTDKRIGCSSLKAGLGFGGFCFPKDLSAFIKIAKETGVNFNFLEDTLAINKKRKEQLVKKIKDALWILSNKTIGILGLSFKPDTDDLREASSLYIIEMLQKENCNIKFYDPVSMPKAKKILTNVTFCDTPYEVAQDSDCLVICTEWQEFKELDLEKIKKLLKKPIIIDGRNIFDDEKMKNLEFIYKRFGK
ncbi:MAG: UDP-glucose/GDP-mannose dehydrogenase family protein [bacterium]